MHKDKNVIVSDSGNARNIWKVLIKKMIPLCITLPVTVMAVVAFFSQAWFANNDNVTAEDMRISPSDKFGFELLTKGVEINSNLKEHLKDSTIQCWLLTAESNLQNNGDKPSGIAPGSSGSLSFYVLPHDDGALSIDCTLDIQPVLKDGNSDSATIEKTIKILRGHLLFVCKYTSGSMEKQTLVDVCNGTFRIELPDDTKANQEQKVTLDWFWPYTLNDAKNYDTYGKEISDLINTQDYSDYFFYDDNKIVDVKSDFRILNHHYNEADQMIGDNVEAVVLQLTADLAS